MFVLSRVTGCPSHQLRFSVLMSIILAGALSGCVFHPVDQMVARLRPEIANIYSVGPTPMDRSSSPNGYINMGVLIPMMKEIDLISSLKDGWHGNGSLQVGSVVLKRTREAAEVISKIEGLSGPYISPNPQGTISLEWESDRGSVYVEIGRTRVAAFIDIAGQEPVAIRSQLLDLGYFTSIKEIISPSLYKF